MANELAKRSVAVKKSAKKAAKKAVKKAAKKSAHAIEVRHAPKKAAKKVAKKAAKKTAKHVAKKSAAPSHKRVVSEKVLTGVGTLLEQAFHHLERAGAVVSLLEAHSGGDLRALLRESAEIYRVALAAYPPDLVLIDIVVGLARASEHVALGAMYAAWEEEPSGLLGPAADEDLAGRARALKIQTESLLETAEGRPRHWLETALSLLEQAWEERQRSHLVWELVSAAESLVAAAERR